MKHKYILYLLIIINILNVFFDRDGAEGSRFLIKALNGLVIMMIFIPVFINKLKKPALLKYLAIFSVLILSYLLISFVYPNEYIEIGNYLRWLLNFFFVIYFFSFDSTPKCDKLFRIYVYTYIFQCAFKVLTGFAVGADEDTLAGDTAGIGFAFILPLIFMFFEDKKAMYLAIACAVLALISLRRTSILAIALSVPFLWPYLKSHVSKKTIFFVSIIGIVCIVLAWKSTGAVLTSRMLELVQGDTRYGDTVSYGSSRSEFWLVLMLRFIENGNYLFGNGLGSVMDCFDHYYLVALPHAHSDVFEILYTFGLVGLTLWLLFVISLFRYIRKIKDTNIKALLYCAYVLYMFSGVVSGALMRAELFPLFISLGLLLGASYRNVKYCTTSFTTKSMVGVK